jgi:hypothetical protein
MFQTITPFLIKYGLPVNGEFDGDDYASIADKVLKKKGTVLMVWEHSSISSLAEELGVKNPPSWDGKDYDSIWIITYSTGKAILTYDKEDITPSSDCKF